MAGPLVQMPGGVDLGAQHGVEPFGAQRGDEAVAEDTRGVHDTGQGPVGGDGREQSGEGFPVGRVAGGDGDLGSQRRERVAQVVGAGGAR